MAHLRNLLVIGLVALAALWAAGEDLSALPGKLSEQLSEAKERVTNLPEPATATPEAAEPVPEPQRSAGPAHLDTIAARRIWQDWKTRHKVSTASMALAQHGQILFSTGQARDPNAAYPLASLSKPITAVCLGQALDQSAYDWSTTLGELARLLAAGNMAPHSGILDLKLSDLATHTSGFPKQYAEEDTAGEGRNLYTQQSFARQALGDPSGLRPTRDHHYSNVNFALLGHVITVLTGAPYSEYCHSTVMQPAGAAGAAVAGRMWGTQGFGGWSASVEDYARFVMHWMHPDRPWIAQAQALPYNSKSGAGLGIFHDWRETSHIVGHTGIWRNKLLRHRHGAMFLTGPSGATFVGNWQGALSQKAYDDLWNSMARVLR